MVLRATENPPQQKHEGLTSGAPNGASTSLSELIPSPELIPLPVAWVKTWTGNQGLAARLFHSTMGSAKDFESAGLRRLLFNACYWCLGMEGDIRAVGSVEVLGEYEPLASGFNYEALGVVPHPPGHYR